MAAVTIYHNPRCTKSREAMQVAEQLGVDVDVVRYLESPPDAATLRAIIAKLEDAPADMVRHDGWKDLGISADDVATPDGVVDVPNTELGADSLDIETVRAQNAE